VWYENVINCLVETTVKPLSLLETDVKHIYFHTFFSFSPEHHKKKREDEYMEKFLANVNKDQQGNITPSWQN